MKGMDSNITLRSLVTRCCLFTFPHIFSRDSLTWSKEMSWLITTLKTPKVLKKKHKIGVEERHYERKRTGKNIASDLVWRGSFSWDCQEKSS